MTSAPASHFTASPRCEVPGHGELVRVPMLDGCHACRTTADAYFRADGGDSLVEYFRETCETCAARRAVAAVDRWFVLPDDAAIQARELQRLHQEFPALARVVAPLLPTPAEPPGKVQLGAVRYQVVDRGGFADEAREAAERVRLGDFGEVGVLGAVEPTGADAFCPGLATQDARNALAIKSGKGVIRARFDYPLPGRTLDVCTVLFPGRPAETYAMLGDRQSHCFGA